MKDAGKDKWIIINPFDSTYSNQIIEEVKNKNDSNVTGLIFETNQIISTNQSYKSPSIISEASYNLVGEFDEYSYNLQPGYIANYSHTFIENCWVLDPVVPTYYIYGGMWALLTLVFTVTLYCMPVSERFSL